MDFHETAYVVVAAADVVGIACSDSCATDTVDDIVADLGEESDAGYDRASLAAVDNHVTCMSCGRAVKA